MRRYRTDLSLHEETILYANKEKYRQRCKICNHSNTILARGGYQPCHWCKNMVFLTPKIEFEYRLKEKIIRERRKENGKERN